MGSACNIAPITQLWRNKSWGFFSTTEMSLNKSEISRFVCYLDFSPKYISDIPFLKPYNVLRGLGTDHGAFLWSFDGWSQNIVLTYGSGPGYSGSSFPSCPSQVEFCTQDKDRLLFTVLKDLIHKNWRTVLFPNTDLRPPFALQSLYPFPGVTACGPV